MEVKSRVAGLTRVSFRILVIPHQQAATTTATTTTACKVSIITE
jgi:hypothetical protein